MRHLILYSLCLWCSLSVAQVYPVSDIPAALKVRALATLRLEDIVIDMKSPQQVTERVEKVITIHHASGDDYGAIALYYNKGKKIKNLSGKILNELGMEVGKFTLKDFKDYSAAGDGSLYEDARVKHYAPHSLRYPYTVAYTYEIEHQQNLSIRNWYPNYADELSIEKSRYSFRSPSAQKIRIHSKNVPLEPTIVTDEKTTTYQWAVEHIEATAAEPFSPPRLLSSMSVQIVPEEFQYFKRRSSFTNWSEFGRWVYDDLLKDKRSLPPETVDAVRRLVASAESDQEKAKLLYKYMQSKTRYISIQIGIGGLEPFDAKTVDRLGYGDCKALVNYMQSLLDVVGIPSYYCVVEGSRSKIDIQADFANASDGNHIILALPFANDTTWLECTSQLLPYGYLGSFTADRLVLACTQDGGQLMRTPAYSAEANIQHRKATLQLSKEGLLSGSVTTKSAGLQMEDEYYQVFEDAEKQLQQLKKSYPLQGITFRDFSYSYHQDTVTEKLDVEIANYLTPLGERHMLTTNVFNIQPLAPLIKQRKKSFYINTSYLDLDETTFILDDALQVMLEPYTANISCAVGSFDIDIRLLEGKIHYTRKMQVHQGTYAAEEYERYYNFIKEVNRQDRLRFALQKL